MNEWYTLTDQLETPVSPLPDAALSRISARAVRAVHRRRRRRWLPLALAAALVLSACGYAAATGQFSHWFRYLAEDPSSPETSEDLLASLGTAIGQSQTADGVTATLDGALWDGNYLVLSLSLQGEDLPQLSLYQVDAEASWLLTSRASMEAELANTAREMTPEQRQAMQDYIDQLYTHPETSVAVRFGHPKIQYRWDEETDVYQLLVSLSQVVQATADEKELTLHLEDLSFYGGKTIAGPFEFTFTVERKQVQQTYTGDMTVEAEDGTLLQIRQVVLAPFRAEAQFAFLSVPGADALDILPSIDMIRFASGLEMSVSSSFGAQVSSPEDGDPLVGSMWTGPFYKVVDPAQVTAVRIGSTWLELDQMDLMEEGG